MVYLIKLVVSLAEYSVLLGALHLVLGREFQVYLAESVVSLAEYSIVLKVQ